MSESNTHPTFNNMHNALYTAWVMNTKPENCCSLRDITNRQSPMFTKITIS